MNSISETVLACESILARHASSPSIVLEEELANHGKLRAIDREAIIYRREKYSEPCCKLAECFEVSKTTITKVLKAGRSIQSIRL